MNEPMELPTEVSERFSMRVEGDVADWVREFAQRYDLPKSVVSRTAMLVAMQPDGPSLEERLEALAEERRQSKMRRQESGGSAGAGSSVAAVFDPALLESLPFRMQELADAVSETQKLVSETLDSGFLAIQNRLDGLENSVVALESQGAVSNSVDTTDSDWRARMAEKLDALWETVSQRADSADLGAENPNGQDSVLKSLDLGVKSLLETVSDRLPEALAEMLESRLVGTLMSRLDGLIEERVSALTALVTQAMERLTNPASDAGTEAISRAITDMRGTVQVLAQDVQELRQHLGAAQTPAVDLSAVEAGMAELRQALDSLLEESAKPFYLQSSKPIGKALVGKLRVVKEA